MIRWSVVAAIVAVGLVAIGLRRVVVGRRQELQRVPPLYPTPPPSTGVEADSGEAERQQPRQPPDDSSAHAPLRGWASRVPWRAAEDGVPLTAGQLRRAPARPTVLADLQVRDAWQQRVRGYNVTPFCVQSGVGWVWLANPDNATAPPSLEIKSELYRSLSAQRSNITAGRKVLWSDAPAALTGVTLPGPPFHVVWNFMAQALAFLSLPSKPPKHYVQTLTDACQYTYGGVCCTDNASVPCSRGLGWHLHSALAPPVPAHDPVRGAEPGATVCHSWGVVAATEMTDTSRSSQLSGRVCKAPGFKRIPKHLRKSKSLVCRPRTRPTAHWADLPPLREWVLRRFSTKPPQDWTAGPKLAGRPKMVVITRGSTRKITTQAEMVEEATKQGWDVAELTLELLPLPQQITLLSTADAVVGIHGSAHIWELFTPPGIVWVEFAPNAMHAPKLVPHPGVVGVNQYHRGTYGGYAGYSGVHHLGWVSPHHLKRSAAGRWKQADVSVDSSTWRRVLNVSLALRMNQTVCPVRPPCDVPV